MSELDMAAATPLILARTLSEQLSDEIAMAEKETSDTTAKDENKDKKLRDEGTGNLEQTATTVSPLLRTASSSSGGSEYYDTIDHDYCGGTASELELQPRGDLPTSPASPARTQGSTKTIILTPFEEHAASVHAIMADFKHTSSTGVELNYSTALAFASKVNAALTDRPAAWATWIEGVLDVNLLRGRDTTAARVVCVARMAHVLGAEHAHLLLDLDQLCPGTREGLLKHLATLATAGAAESAKGPGSAAAGDVLAGDAQVWMRWWTRGHAAGSKA